MFIKISRFFLYAAAFTPLLLSKRLFFPFITTKSVFFKTVVELALLFFIIHIVSAQDPKKIWQQIKARFSNPIFIAIGLFAILGIFTALISINPTQAFWSNFERAEGAFQIFHYALFFFLVALTFTEKKALQTLIFTHIGVSILVAGYGALQVYGNPAHPLIVGGGDRASGTLGNASYLAAYLLMTLPFLGYFFLKMKDKWLRIGLILIALFEIFIMTKTGTRGAFLGLFVGLLALLFISMFTAETKKWRLTSQIGFALIAGLGVLFFATSSAPIWQNIPGINERLLDFSGATEGIKPRLWTWGSSISTFLERPVFGWGYENFPYGFDKYYNTGHYLVESFFDRTHNVFLEYLISGGIVLFLAWLSIFYFYLRQVLRKKDKDMWFAILVSALIAYFVQGFFLFDVLPIYLTVFLFLVLFINTEKDYPPLEEETTYRISGGSFATSVVATILIITSLIMTVGLPLQKNLLLSRSVILQNTFRATQIPVERRPSFAAVIESYEKTYNFSSPVGQEETISMFLRFTAEIMEYFAHIEQSQKNETVQNEVDNVYLLAANWFDENRNLFPGHKNTYLAGALHFNHAFTTVDGQMRVIYPESLARGEELYAEVLEEAPTRIEFMVILREMAARQNDDAKYQELTDKLKALRPDLKWDTNIVGS